MTEIVTRTYRCDICDSVYEDENACLACEASHPNLLTVKKWMQGYHHRYPRIIVASFDDGVNVKYSINDDRFEEL